MLTTVLAWWLQQLRTLLPQRWRDGATRLPDALIVDCGPLDGSPSGGEVLQRRRRQESRVGPLGTGLPPMARCILRLTGSPLQREVVLPAAVEGDIPRLLAHDMGRLAPFDAADIVWDWRIIRRDAARKRLTVQLWYVPRKTLQPMLALLDGFHLAPSELEMVGPDGRCLRLTLREPPSRRGLARWVGAMAAIILLAAAATPFVLQSLALDDLDRQLAAVRPKADRAEALRQRFTSREPGEAVRAAEARRVGDALEALAAVSNALPDDTVLIDLTVRDRKLTVTGSSSEAALLIAALSGVPLIRDPAFTAPIVRDPATARDSFTLHADLAP